jgi:tetratricopeptide (TPR) repeat protein
MRIQCEVCSATYTIDDAQLSDQPIGAQCPYCGHVKLVTRMESPAGAAPPDPPAPSGPEPPPVPPAPSTSSDDAARSLGFSEPPPGFSVQSVQQAQAQQPPSGPGEYSSVSGMGFREPPPPPPGPAPTGPAPSGVDTIADQMDWGSDEADRSLGETSSTCSVCGAPLKDEFDRVIGLCEVHQRDQRGEEPLPTGADGLHDQWWVRPRHGGHPSGPYSLEDLRGRLRRGELAPTDQVSKDGQQFSSVERYPELAYITALQTVRGPSARATGVSVHAGPDLGRWARLGIVLLVVGALAYGAWSQRDLLGRIYANLMEGRVSTAPIGLNPLRRSIEGWKVELGPVNRELSEVLAEGRELHRRDDWQSYDAADRKFRQALILRPEDPGALGAYIENLVIWKHPLLSEERRQQLARGIRYGLRRDPDHPAVHRAAAALALARNQLNVCQEHADRALSAAPADSQARLLLAGCFLQGNVPLALQQARAAKQASPELLRADRVLADGLAQTGRYTSADALLSDRIERSPDNAIVHIERGELRRMISSSEEAEKSLRRAAELEGYDQQAFMRLGDLQLELRRPGQAIAAFQGALEAHEPQGRRGAHIYTGLARAELLAGRPRRAAQMADEALSFDREHLPALILRGEAALLLEQMDVAVQMSDRALKEGPNEPSALVLAGRTATRQGRVAIGRQHLERAARNDRRDPRLAGILAAHYLEQGMTNQAYVLMRDAAEVDPEEAKARNRFTAVALSDAPVAEAIASFQQSSKVRRNAPVAYAVMGLMYYFSGEPQRAYEAVRRSLRLDDANLVGLIYQAQLDLEAGRLARGERAMRRLLAIEKGFSLAYVILARIQVAQGDLDAARESYRAALRSNPGFVAARVELAGLDLAAGAPNPRVEEELQKVFSFHPNSVRLRRLMMEAGL